jgi:geranylgeranylglycerol-phosphate geranylgeranyltransferase
MNSIIPSIKILRPGNAAMAALAVMLGFWLSGNYLPFISLFEMLVASVCSVGFGNVLNDIIDVAADRINHPARPLPKGELSIISAISLLFFLCIFAVVNAYLVSMTHCLGVLVPLGLLSLYAFYLKQTPFVGNIIVSLLVAYPILFGGMGAPHFDRLILPAMSAFFLNCAREIIKDIEDQPGDAAFAVKTTARLQKSLLKAILLALSAFGPLLLALPFLLKQFGPVYLFISIFAVLPLHFYWVFFTLQFEWDKFLQRISLTLKIEMLAGLLALAADQAYFLLR